MTDIPGVGWALWSKRAGTSSDYSVLGCSTDLFSRADFGKIITRFGGGTPDSRATGAEKLPWVTLSWVGVEAGLRLGIAITGNNGQVDAVGRPIIETSYFCVPYQAVARARLSYTALHDAVAQIGGLPAQDGAMITLGVPDEAPGQAAHRLEGDLERIAWATAALLLRGPVTVTQADGSSLTQRLAFIDAVASLLPFGLRAKLTAGTWSDSGVRHRLRLAFASRPRDDAEAIAWRTGGEVTGADVARDYYQQLRQLRGGTATHRRKFEAATVVAHLEAGTEQQKFEQPQEALSFLRLIDLPDRVLAAVRAGGPVDPAELRQVFRLGHFDAMDPGARLDLLTALSDISEASDWPAIDQRLGQLPDPRTVGRILVKFGWRVLWAEGQPDVQVLRGCMAAADSAGIGDSVLAGLVRMPEPPAGPSAGASAAATLLTALVLRGGRPDAYPVTRNGLAGQPATVAEYLAALVSPAVASAALASAALVSPGVASAALVSPGVASPGVASAALANPGVASPAVASAALVSPGLASPGVASAALAGPVRDEAPGQDAAALLRWLASGLPPSFVRAFESALGRREADVSGRDIVSVADLGNGCIRALLATASATGRLDLVLPICTRWIASPEDLAPGVPEYWNKYLRPLKAPTPRLRACLDLALMSVGAAPTALPPDRPPASLDYLSGFTDMWKQLRKFPASRERCVRSMARFLRKERWAESRGHAEAVTVLAEQLRRDDSNNELVGVVASALQASREAAQWDFARGWVDQVRGNDPGAIRSGLLSALAAVEPGADPVQVATLLRDAQREGINSDQACYVLARVKAIDSPRAAVDVAGALRWEFERSGIDKKETEDWLLGFIQLVARGGFGPEVAAGLTGSLSQAARQEIELQLEILYALAERPGQGELELTDGERAQLEEMRDTIDLLIRKSAKHYLSGLVRKVMRE